ncbi:hypothetical protein MXB_1130 [Myxobolus squamalis]|nr:hypothetical protein MXB_1130 [Myxobolus squamalis]
MALLSIFSALVIKKAAFLWTKKYSSTVFLKCQSLGTAVFGLKFFWIFTKKIIFFRREIYYYLWTIPLIIGEIKSDPPEF